MKVRARFLVWSRLLAATALGCLLALTGCGQVSSVDVPDGSGDLVQGGSSATVASASIAVTDYSDPANWAYYEVDEPAAADTADVFFICPSVYGGSDDVPNMSLDDDEARASFVGATNMEKGIYDQGPIDDAQGAADGTADEGAVDEEDGTAPTTAGNRFFAPFYQQIGLSVYELPEDEREPYLEVAYADVEAAFDYYLENVNDGRPIVLAGFSQGADMCIRLMKERFADPALRERLVACYAIGWRLTQDEADAYPQLRTATGADDTGVIVSFNSEAPEVTGSLLVPEGEKTLGINPLNWRTDSTPATASENAGACFTDYSGAITEEIPGLTGAYLDIGRGTLKVPDVTSEEYPAGLSIFEDGVYHLYDYQFFYRNLQENVEARLDAYLAAH